MNFSPPTADELPLIFDAWARSFKKSPWAGCIRNDQYDAVSRSTMSEILARPTTRVICATVDLEDGKRRVLGYSVSEPSKQVLHWLFVKRDYRGNGFGHQLLDETCPRHDKMSGFGWTYTHRTRASAKFLGPAFKWDPIPARVK